MWHSDPTWAVSDGAVSASTWNTSLLRGVVLVVYGEQAETSARRALTALSEVCPALPVTVYRQRTDGYSDMQCSRWAKVTMLDWTPYTYTAYMDADTQIYQSIDAGFAALEDGFDMALCPSQHQGDQMLWHIGEAERRATLEGLPLQPLQLQAGVLFVARNERTRALWACWREEWLKWRDQDQAALLRALMQCPVKVWLLGHPYNGSYIVGHHWGSIRREGNAK